MFTDGAATGSQGSIYVHSPVEHQVSTVWFHVRENGCSPLSLQEFDIEHYEEIETGQREMCFRRAMFAPVDLISACHHFHFLYVLVVFTLVGFKDEDGMDGRRGIISMNK